MYSNFICINKLYLKYFVEKTSLSFFCVVLKVVNMFSMLDLAIEHFFHQHIASCKYAGGEGGSENSRELCKPGMPASLFSQTPSD